MSKLKGAEMKDDALKWICERAAAICNHPDVFSCTWIADGIHESVYKVRKYMKELEADGYVRKDHEGGVDGPGAGAGLLEEPDAGLLQYIYIAHERHAQHATTLLHEVDVLISLVIEDIGDLFRVGFYVIGAGFDTAVVVKVING